MNKKKLYAFYGSLRPGMYNFSSRDIEVIKDNVEVKGKKLLTLGHDAYPYVTHGDEDQSIKVTLCKIPNDIQEKGIHRMELGAGYHYHEMEIEGDNYGIYLITPEQAENGKVILDGDWVKYKTNDKR